MERTLARVRAGTSYTPALTLARITRPTPTPSPGPCTTRLDRRIVLLPAAVTSTSVQPENQAQTATCRAQYRSPRQLELSARPNIYTRMSLARHLPPPSTRTPYKFVIIVKSCRTSTRSRKLRAPSPSPFPMIDRHRVTPFARSLKGFLRGIIRPSSTSH